ncbi:unnamed protein product [Larinioides sclopetarius]|uniref:Uncharacterized protein n=1 Tax=Larinioides sclopetarius TaxID=280406 RepID=A0AAV1Z7B2_9ARAC
MRLNLFNMRLNSLHLLGCLEKTDSHSKALKKMPFSNKRILITTYFKNINNDLFLR